MKSTKTAKFIVLEKSRYTVIHFNVLLYWNFVRSVTRRVGFAQRFICRKLAVTRTNDQGLTNLYGSLVFHFEHRLVLLSGPLKSQAGSFNRYKQMYIS